MSTFKKLLALLLCLLMVFAIAACGDDAGKDDDEEEGPSLNAGDADCEHVWTEWEITKENSCTKKGTQYRKCEECGKEEEEELLAYGHVFYGSECETCGKAAIECDHPDVNIVVMSDATCTEDGEEREVCKRCKAVVDFNYIYAFGHPETKTVVISEATCTENGEEHEICTICGEVADINYTWSYGHDYVYHSSQDPTCTEQGWRSYYTCSRCDYSDEISYKDPKGHDYRAGTCTVCEYVDPNFKIVTAPGLVHNSMAITKAEGIGMVANTALLELYSGNISVKDQVDTYTFTAAVNGRYLVWMDEIYSGNSFELYIKDSLGDTKAVDYSCYNGEGQYMDLTAGTYTIEVRYDGGFSTYNLHIGHQKDSVDISAVDAINDSMEFLRQINKYTFTPNQSGVYYFGFSEITNNSNLFISVWNRLNERVDYASYCSNGEGLKVRLNAGETYTVYVENTYEVITPYTLSIGKQTATTDISGYTQITDAISFYGQENLYTFTATGSTYSFVISDMNGSARVDMYLVNYLGENVTYDTYCGNNTTLSVSNLVAGQTYTVKIIQRSETTAYKLQVLSQKAAIDLTSDMAVKDTTEYYGQQNVYHWTATKDGTHYVMLLIHEYSDSSYLSIAVYDENGNRIGNDSTVYNGGYFTFKNIVSGGKYTIYVSYKGTSSYTLSIQ